MMTPQRLHEVTGLPEGECRAILAYPQLSELGWLDLQTERSRAPRLRKYNTRGEEEEG
jgi:hypothetical protein